MSTRVNVRAERLANTKRLTIKAPRLPAMVPRLVEDCAFQHQHGHNQVFAVFLLLMIVERVRCADAVRIAVEAMLGAVEDGTRFIRVAACQSKGGANSQETASWITVRRFWGFAERAHQTSRGKACKAGWKGWILVQHVPMSSPQLTALTHPRAVPRVGRR